MIFDNSMIFSFLIAILLGALIGIERDLPKKTRGKYVDEDNFGGVRTFSLISLLGAMSAAIGVYAENVFIAFIPLILLMVFFAIYYVYTVFKQERLGITTELSGVLTYFLGFLVAIGFVEFAIILTIILTVILSLKGTMEKIKQKISYEELKNTIKFGAVAFVVLPLLPNSRYSIADGLGALGYEGAENIQNALLSVPFFNPYGIWFFVVAMAAISYAGYVFSKVVGEKSSILLSGAIGGLISSTAVTASMSEMSKKDTKNMNMYVVATLTASAIMFLRVILIVLFFNVSLVGFITYPAVAMFIGMLLFILYFLYKGKKETKREKYINIQDEYQSPFTLIPALKFAGFVILIKFISAVGVVFKDVWGEGIFYYILGIISGLADVDAISQTMAVDAKAGVVLPLVASITVIIAIFSNNIVKGMMAYKFGDKRYGKIVLAGFLVSMVFGFVGIGVASLVN